MLHDIDQYVDQYNGVDTSMEMPDIGQYCLAKIDGKYNRAKILSNFCRDNIFYAKVLCCDIGIYAVCDIDHIMSIPDHLLNALPFQAIWCCIYGLKRCDSTNGVWPRDASDQIFDDMIDPVANLMAKLISLNDIAPSEVENPFKMQQMNIILMSNDCVINRLIVEREMAVFEADAERVIDTNCTINYENGKIDDEEYSSDDGWNDAGDITQSPLNHKMEAESNRMEKWPNLENIDVHFDLEDLDDLFPSAPLKAIKAELNNVDADSAKEKRIQLKSSISDSDNGNGEENATKNQSINKLKYKYKVPYVTWHQSDELIVLSIKADENVVYNLDVTSHRLMFR